MTRSGVFFTDFEVLLIVVKHCHDITKEIRRNKIVKSYAK